MSLNENEGFDSSKDTHLDQKWLLDHKRKRLRLWIAAGAIAGSMLGIIVFVIFSYVHPNGDGETARTAVNSFTSIATLALGFIAGSNIE